MFWWPHSAKRNWAFTLSVWFLPGSPGGPWGPISPGLPWGPIFPRGPGEPCSATSLGGRGGSPGEPGGPWKPVIEARWDSLIKTQHPIFSLMCFHPWICWCYLAACVREGLWSATRHLGYSSCIYNIGEMSVSMGIAIGEHKDKQKEMNDATAPSFMTGNWEVLPK